MFSNADTMAETTTQRTCPQDCRLCTLQQHAYCSAAMTFAMLKTIDNMTARIDELTTTIAQLKGDAELADPLTSETPESTNAAGANVSAAII